MDGAPQGSDAAWARPGTAESTPVDAARAAGAQPASAPLPPDGFWSRRALEVRTAIAGLTLSQIFQIIAMVAVFATAGFGGLATAKPVPKTFAPGQAHGTGQTTIVVQRATLLAEVVGDKRVVYKKEPGRMYLAVRATITNNGKVTEGFGSFGGWPLILVGIPHKKAYPDGPLRISDSSRAQLQPGQTGDLAFVWSIPADALHPGDDVVLRVPNRVFTHYSVGYGSGWVDGRTYADVTVKAVAPQ